jgi:hypothetical protein
MRRPLISSQPNLRGYMKQLLFLLLIALCFPVLCFGEQAEIPLEELVQDSDLIVVGRLQSVSGFSKDDTDYAQGTIIVDEVIWGKVGAGDKLTLKWQNQSNIICPRVEHAGAVGKQGIWLLTVTNPYEVRADHYGRFIQTKERSTVERLLLQKPISIRMLNHSVTSNDPLNFWLVYRNFSPRVKRFPGVEYRDGSLFLTPDTKIEININNVSGIKRVPLSSQRVTVSKNMPAIVVQPKQEVRVEMSLRRLLEASPGHGDWVLVRFIQAKYSPSNNAGFYIYDREQSSDSKLSAEVLVKKPVKAYASKSKYSPLGGFLAFLLALASYLKLYRFQVR